MGNGNMVQIYRGAPTSPKLIELISSQRKLEELAGKLIRKNEISVKEDKFYIENKEVKLFSRGEAIMFKSLSEIGVRMAYEPICFFMPGLRDALRPDVFTNIIKHDGKVERYKHKSVNAYKNEKVVMVEMHGMDWLIEKEGGKAISKGNFYLNKLKQTRGRYPEIYSLFICDLDKKKIESTFSVSVNQICDEYHFMPQAYQKQSEILNLFESLIERKDMRVERNRKLWNKRLTKIARKELEMVRQEMHGLR